MEADASSPAPLARLSRLLALVILGVGIALRFLLLDADPEHVAWTGYITDEGRWIAHARALALFGNASSVGSPLHLLLAPLYQAAAYVVFLALGVSLATTRLVSALCGSLLLVVFWTALRGVTSPPARLLALALLAFELDVVFLSRLAIPEMAAMLCELLAYLLLAGECPGRGRLVAAGVMTAAAVGMKATVLPVACFFALLVLVRPVAPDGLSRRSALTAFAAGAVGPFVAGGLAYLATWPGAVTSLSRTARLVGSQAGVGDLAPLVRAPFDNELMPVFGIWLLGAWLALVAPLALSPEAADGGARRHLLATGGWATLYAAILFVADYSPSRYWIHLLVPLAVLIAVGVTALQRADLGARAHALAGWHGLRRHLAAIFVALPTAVILTPLAAAAAAGFGFDPTRARVRYGGMALLLVVAAVVAYRLGRGRSLSAFILFPSIWTLGWLLVHCQGPSSRPFWPTGGVGEDATRWLLLGSAAVGAVALAAPAPRGRVRGVAAGLVAASVIVAVAGLARLAPGYLNPHYSIREASRDLAVRLGDASGRIGAAEGEVLFSDNRLAYRSIFGRRFPSNPPDFLVMAARLDDPRGVLGRDYALIHVYSIHISPEYIRSEFPMGAPPESVARSRIRVYRRISPE